MKYYDIHVSYGDKDSDGYSIPVAIENGCRKVAVRKAINDALFEDTEDVRMIDYIEELTEEEYNKMTA